MKNMNMRDLYNPEIKEQFLNSLEGAEGSKLAVYYSLKRAGKTEKALNKDLYEMTATDLSDVFSSARRTSGASMRNFISNISSYMKWAEDEGYRDTMLPVFTGETMTELAEKFIWDEYTEFYTQEDLLQYYRNFPNKSDIVIIQCIFEGIKGKGYSEIFSLKEDDLYEKDNKYYANLSDTERGITREDFEISEFLYELLLEVAAKSTVIDMRGKEVKLIPSQYIIKKSTKGNRNQSSGEKLTSTYIMNKPAQYRKIIGSEDFSFRNVEKSGVMHFVNNLLEDRDKKLVTFDDYVKISDKFNVGKYRHSFYEGETVNYKAVREMIDIEFYQNNYGEIELM